MSNTLVNQLVTLSQRQHFITALPCLSMLSSRESAELANLMEEVHFAHGEKIVIENGIVDSVFIIVEGSAEILRADNPIATISSGNSIGLNNTGFFSKTGKRTATIVALSDVLALKLDLIKFHDFLAHHSHLKFEMQDVFGQILRMKLIKQSLPFSNLSSERVQTLSQHVEEIFVPAGEIIFNQGDVGDRCFLIQSGQVEIFGVGEGDVEHRLAVLKSPTLFGEATLITQSPRNATARAVEDCKLLVFSHEYLAELLETENNLANMFMTLMIDRSRPLKNPDIVVHERETVAHQNIVILKNPENGTYFKLTPEGWFIWQMLDGEHSMQEITLSLADHFNIFAPDIVAGLISKLANAGFILNVMKSTGASTTNQPLWARVATRMRNLLEKRIVIGDADKLLTNIYNYFGYWLFTPIALSVLALVAIAGIFSFGYVTPHCIYLFKTIAHSWTLFVLVLLFSIFSIMLHELGHALATKAFGNEVHYMGVGWFWLGPVAFTDTSDMWLSSRWPRVMVNLAGVGMDLIFGAICTFFIFIFHNEYLQGFFWLFALYTYVNAFRILSPLQELDGYYVLMDLLDRSRLRQSAIVWLLKDFPKAIRHPSLFKQHTAEVIYWVCCLVFLFLLSLVTWYVQGVLFDMLRLPSSNLLLSLTLPVLVVVLASLSIIAEVRQQAEK